MTTGEMGAMGSQLANALADKAIETIKNFPASTPAERATIAREVAGQLVEYAESEGGRHGG